MVVAVLGTTISPYLFFWQAAQEVEDSQRRPERDELRRAPPSTRREHLRAHQGRHLRRHGLLEPDRLLHHLATAVTLHAAGITDIQTSAQAAEALRPIAGEFAFMLFAWASSAPGCSPCRCSPARRPMRWARLFGWQRRPVARLPTRRAAST